MAAINFTPISLYYTTTASAVPSAGNLVAGELALNTTDEKLYFKNAAGTVKLLASNAATAAGVDSFSAGTTGLTPSTSTTGAITLAGTLANTNGGTGATAAFTQYGITYASSTTVLATTAAGTSTTVLHGNASGAPTFGAVSLTADVSGVLPTANGGTNLSSFTANGVVYASSTSALATQSGLTYDGTNLDIGTGKKLETNHSASVYQQLFSTAGGNFLSGFGDNLQLSSDVGAVTLTATSAQPVILATNNLTRLQIGAAGQFGIGGATYGTAGDVLTSGGASAAPTWTTPASGVSLSANNTWTGTQTLQGSATNVATILQDAVENVFIVAGNNNTNNNGFFYGGSVTYYTTNNSANWSQNLTFSGSANLNTVMSVGQSMTMAILSTNGGTAYYPTSILVDSGAGSTTIKWQGGTAPTAGNASSIDVYTYTVIKTASNTWTILASQTKFA
jgi:hypothetical protein